MQNKVWVVSSGQGAKDDDIANSEFNLIDGDPATSFRAKTAAQKEYIQVKVTPTQLNRMDEFSWRPSRLT